MTAVKGPFVFTSDRWSDDFITKAKSAGCKSLALQLGVAPAGAADKVRAAGLQVIGWGSSNSIVGDRLNTMKPSVWMPQIESTFEFNALIEALDRGAGWGFPCEPVATSAGMETEKPNATDAEKVAERNRRRDLLRSFGVTKVWVEVYKQDADRSGQVRLGQVNSMCVFFEDAFGFEEAHPVIGLWAVDDSQPWAKNPYSVSKYDLSVDGRTFGAWRAEQMADARYAEMAAVPDVVVLPPPPPPVVKYPTKEAREDIEIAGLRWEACNSGPKPFTRITLAKRIASKELSDAEWRRQKVGEAISLLLDQAEAIE